jgi:hypothetical protein
MPAYFPDVGRKLTLDILLASGRSAKLKLFKNDVTLAQSLVLGGLTEADFPGYAAIDLSAVMGPAVIRGDGKGAKVNNTNQFVRSSTGTPQNIYGWHITILDLGAVEKLLILRKFSAPVVVETAGHFVQFDLEVLDDLGT